MVETVGEVSYRLSKRLEQRCHQAAQALLPGDDRGRPRLKLGQLERIAVLARSYPKTGSLTDTAQLLQIAQQRSLGGAVDLTAGA